jgi:thiol:disulfide interchange protein DsbC
MATALGGEMIMQRAIVAAVAAVVGGFWSLGVAADTVQERIEQRLAGVGLDVTVERIAETPIAGVHMVSINGDIVFFSEDGRYLIQGEMVDLQRRESVAEVWFRSERSEQLAAYDESFFLVFPAQGDTRHVVTVFTDIDCPYCQRMHDRIEDYTALGIKVRYVQFPRAGVDSPSYNKAVSVWCAEDRHAAMDAAKAGRSVPLGMCENPVAEQFELARRLGINATPTFVSDRGAVHRGLMSPAELLQRLDAETE